MTATLVVIGSVTAREYTPVREEMRNANRGPKVIRVSNEQLDRFIRAYLNIEAETSRNDLPPGMAGAFSEGTRFGGIKAAIIGCMGIRNPLAVDRIILSEHAYQRLTGIVTMRFGDMVLLATDNSGSLRTQGKRVTLLSDMLEVLSHCRDRYIVQNGRPEPIRLYTV